MNRDQVSSLLDIRDRISFWIADMVGIGAEAEAEAEYKRLGAWWCDVERAIVGEGTYGDLVMRAYIQWPLAMESLTVQRA